jgi:fibronectin-binding autotransporter adhesin
MSHQRRRVCRVRAATVRAAAAAVVVSVAAQSVARAAADSFIPGSAADWFTAGNWSLGTPPTSSDDGFVNSGGIVQITTNGAPAAAQNLLVGSDVGLTGGGSITTGTLTIAKELQIGGRFLSGETLGVLGGTGTFAQSGGVVSVGSFTNVGVGGNFSTATAAAGTYTISGGTLSAGLIFAIGNGSTAVGHVVQTGGSVSAATINLGRGNGTGFYDVSNGAVATSGTADLLVGASGRGDFHQSGTATVTLSSNLNLGTSVSVTPPGAIAAGTYTIDGGTLTFAKTASAAIMAIGNGSVTGSGTLAGITSTGFGTVVQNGGVVSMASNALIDLGRGGANGVYVMAGGTLTTGTIQFGTGTNGATRRFQMSGGVVNASSITFGASSLTINSDRRFDVSGGSLTTGSFLLGGGASLNISGGSVSIASLLLSTGTKLRTSIDLALGSTVTNGNSEIQVDANTLALTGTINNVGRNLNKTGGGTLTLSGTQNHTFDAAAPTVNPQLSASAGTLNLNADGGTNLIVNANAATNFGVTQHLAALNVSSAATASLGAGADKGLVVGSLNLDGGATPTVKLDLHDNDLIVNYSGGVGSTVFPTVQAQIKSAYNGGGWTGNGITSSEAGANHTAHGTALGYVEAADAGYANGTFSGQSVDGDAVLVRYTLSGDSNVDGTVDLTDFTFLAANFNKVGGANWLQGDYNYDGTVDLTDFTFLASNFNQSMPANGGSPSSVGTLVPEPASTAMLALCGGALIRRRRRRAGAR